jgi:hypothetical protein
MTTATSTYLYCVVHSDDPPALAGVPAGVPGAGPPRTVAAGDGLFAVVASVPPDLYGEERVNAGLTDLDWVAGLAVAHEAVTEHFLLAAVVLPVKLLTIFESDARALADLRGRRAEIDATFERIAGRREWGVRIEAEPPSEQPPPAPPESGAEFLRRKRAARSATADRRRSGRESAERAFASLAAIADDSRRGRLPAAGRGRVLIDGALLVRTDATALFDRCVAEQASACARDGLALTITGPWPAYNFVRGES